MSLTKKKHKILGKLSAIGTTLALVIMQGSTCFASSIGTAEVEQATENIKRVITSIAMPLRRCLDFCKYSSCSIPNDSQF